MPNTIDINKVGCHGRSQEERGWRSHNPRVGSAHA